MSGFDAAEGGHAEDLAGRDRGARLGLMQLPRCKANAVRICENRSTAPRLTASALSPVATAWSVAAWMAGRPMPTFGLGLLVSGLESCARTSRPSGTAE
ncbi:hypothetical protein [Kutzneria sp. NPDC051319]|uniref:hypothetical protein n=1 Tax=Kutzneria sp. NPDC051319 TaxID=3155047 RepID=UPI0034374DD3